MGNRVFATSPRDLADRLKAWGWRDEGRVLAHPTVNRWVWPESNKSVQVPNGTGKRIEKAVGLAIKQAASVMGVPIGEFMDGRRTEQVRSWKQVDLVELDRQLQQLAKEEPPMPVPQKGEWPEDRGWSQAVVKLLRSRPNHAFHIKEIEEHLRSSGLTGFSESFVAGRLSQMAKKTNPDTTGANIVRVGRGTYLWDPHKFAAKPEPAVSTPQPNIVTDETPVKAAHESVAKPKPEATVATHATTAVPVSNGSTPELLQRVTLLDGGRVLMQGDDGSLYICRMVRLDVSGV